MTPAEVALQLTDVDRVTVYRTLGTLNDAHLLHAVTGTDGVGRFQAHDLSGPGCPGDHPHFLCTVCGAMRCLHDQHLPWVQVPEGATVEGKQFVVYGRCAACNSNGDEP